MLALLLSIVIFLICFGVGAKLLRLLGLFRFEKVSRGPAPSIAEEFVFATPLGLGLLAYLILLLGLLRLLYVWAFPPLLLLLAILGWKEIVRLLSGIGRGLRKGLKTTFSYWSGALGFWLVVMIPLAILGALAPSAGAEWDGLAYHLAVPKIYLQQHHILSLPWMSHSNFPFLLEMLYLLGLALQGQALAKLFHLGFGLLIGAALYTWGNNSFGRGAGILAAALFVAVPVVFWEATVAYNELAFALFCLLALWAWWKRSGEKNPGGWTVLSGLFAGLALATKMLAGFLVIFLLLAIFWRKRSEAATAEEGQPALGRSLALWLIPVALVALPWYIKSFVWTGNPVYPFFYGLFDGRWWSAELAGEYARAQAKFGLGHGPGWLLALPWTITMYSRYFYDQPETRITFNMLISVFGPLFLAFLPAVLWRVRRDALLRYLLAFCGVAVLSWFFLSAQTGRYLLPILPLLALAIAGALLQLLQSFPWLRIISGIAIGLELAVGLATALLLVGPQVSVAIGGEGQASYLSRALNIYPIVRRVNSELPKEAKIMLLGDTRGFYLDREYMWGIGHHNLITPQETATPQALSEALRRLGVTHLLISPEVRRGLVGGEEPLQRSLRALLENERLAPIMEDNKRGFAVLALK